MEIIFSFYLFSMKLSNNRLFLNNPRQPQVLCVLALVFFSNAIHLVKFDLRRTLYLVDLKKAVA